MNYLGVRAALGAEYYFSRPRLSVGGSASTSFSGENAYGNNGFILPNYYSTSVRAYEFGPYLRYFFIPDSTWSRGGINVVLYAGSDPSLADNLSLSATFSLGQHLFSIGPVGTSLELLYERRASSIAIFAPSSFPSADCFSLNLVSDLGV